MWVPFPHVERPIMVPRPALVLTSHPIGLDGILIWTAMITNAVRPDWPGDVPINDAVALGLLIPSKIRTAKISAVEAAAATPIAQVDDETMKRVAELVRSYLGFA